MQTLNATDVRKDLGGFIDSVIREKPKVIKRSRDYILAVSLDMMKELLNTVSLSVTLLKESDGSYTGVIEDLDIMANSATEETLLDILAKDALEYAEDYYNEFNYWYSAPNRRAQLQYIMMLLSKSSLDDIKETFICQVGES